MNRIKFNSIKNSLNVITGCGSGLGRATLQRFIKSGSGPILGIDRQYPPDYLDQLELDKTQRDKIVLRTHDTFNEAETEASLSAFVDEYGRIDNVVNVAGVALAFLLYSHNKQTVYSDHHAQNLLKFNVVGTFNIIRIASKYMIDQSVETQDLSKTKCIINTSSISSSSPTPGQTFYAGTQSSIDSMTLCIARELSPFSIRCNTINVGYFDTPLLRSSDKLIDYIGSKIAVCPSKLGHPDEFAHLVQAMIENQMFNGCCVKIDAATKEIYNLH